MKGEETPRVEQVLVGKLSSSEARALSGSYEPDPRLAGLFEQITRRLEQGESVDIEEVAAENPEWAGQLRGLFPALRELARFERESLGNGPRVFGDFRIVREIGRGGMGIVYEAEQVGMSRRVALKVLPTAAAVDRRALQRFELEAQVAGWLQHPRIVPIFGVGKVGEVPYYTMRYIEGGSLADLIAELRELVGALPDFSPSALALEMLSGRFAPAKRVRESGRSDAETARDLAAIDVPPVGELSIRTAGYIRTVARLGVQAAEALGYAHDQGVVHRDIKPANLLLDHHGSLWVADFGMADIEGDAGLTLTGDLPGTLRYMSPEQALGPRALVDRRTDIYSLGVTLYELLALEPAVAGGDRQEIFRRIGDTEPAPLRRVNPAVPVDLATIIAKAMSKDPSSRYETAWRLADDLGRFLGNLPIAARPVGPLVRGWRWCRRKPVPAALAASLALAVLGGLTGISLNWREAVRQRGLAALERDQSDKAAAINRFLTEKLLLQAAPEQNPRARTVTLREALDHAADDVGSSFRGHPETEAAVRLALGQAFHELGEYAKSEAHLRAAHNLLSASGTSAGTDRLRVEIELGHILFHRERLDESESLLAKAEHETRQNLGSGHEL
jgi:serine/threonine-protein kinase